jgi:mono/diheme cytochrome c family protein
MRHDLRRSVIATGIAPFLLLLLVVSSCGESSEETEPAKPEISAEMIEVGKAVFEDWACADCHGDEGEQTEDAPPLTGLAANWTVDTLAEYVSDPQSFIEKDSRLQEIAKSYPDTEMPAYDVFPAEERRALAAYLLAR